MIIWYQIFLSNINNLQKFDTQLGPYQVLAFQVRVDLGLMVMKLYSTLLRATELEPHQQMQFSFIPRTRLFESLTPLQRIQCILSPANKAEE